MGPRTDEELRLGKETRYLQLRFEAQNLFNHMNAGNPDGKLTNRHLRDDHVSEWKPASSYDRGKAVLLVGCNPSCGPVEGLQPRVGTACCPRISFPQDPSTLRVAHLQKPRNQDSRAALKRRLTGNCRSRWKASPARSVRVPHTWSRLPWPGISPLTSQESADV